MGKGEIDPNKQFLLFSQCFPLNQIIASPFIHIFHIIFLLAAEFEKPKIEISGKGISFFFCFQKIGTASIISKHEGYPWACQAHVTLTFDPDLT